MTYIFAGKVAEACNGIAFHLKVDNDLAGILLFTNADLVGIEVGTGEARFVARIVLGVLCWIKSGTSGCWGRAGVPEFQLARSK